MKLKEKLAADSWEFICDPEDTTDSAKYEEMYYKEGFEDGWDAAFKYIKQHAKVKYTHEVQNEVTKYSMEEYENEYWDDDGDGPLVHEKVTVDKDYLEELKEHEA